MNHEVIAKAYTISMQQQGMYKIIELSMYPNVSDTSGRNECFTHSGGPRLDLNYQTSIGDNGNWLDPYCTSSKISLIGSGYEIIEEMPRLTSIMRTINNKLNLSINNHHLTDMAKYLSKGWYELVKSPHWTNSDITKLVSGRYHYSLLNSEGELISTTYLADENASLADVQASCISKYARYLSYDANFVYSRTSIMNKLQECAQSANFKQDTFWNLPYCFTLDSIIADLKIKVEETTNV